MSNTSMKVTRLLVGPTSTVSPPSSLNFIVNKGTYADIPELAEPQTVAAFVNQNTTASFYVLSDGGAYSYWGTTAAPEAASLGWNSSTNTMHLFSDAKMRLHTPGNEVIVTTSNCVVQGALILGDINNGTTVSTSADSAKIVKAPSTFASQKTYTLPDITGSFILDAGTQSIGGDKTFTGTLVVPYPTLSTHAATKSYVDSVATGLDFKNSVRVASTAGDVALTGTAPLTVDSVSLVSGNRVLLTAQTSAAANGIYDYVVATGNYTLTRSADADSSAEVNSGLYTYVEEGTVNAGFGFVLATANPIVLDTTALNFVVFNQVTTYTAGNGLQLVGTEFSVASTIATGAFEATSYVKTPSIEPLTVGGTITFNSADLSSIDNLSAASATVPIINATGATTLGNASAAMGIVGNAITLTGPTEVAGTLRADSVRLDTNSNQVILGSDNTNNLTITAATSGLAAPKTYTVPIASGSTANLAVIEGSAPSSTDYVLVPSAASSHLATWAPMAQVKSYRANTNTTATSAVYPISFATTSGSKYCFTINVVANNTTNDEIASYQIVVPVKNVAGTLTVGSPMQNLSSYDATFTGDEVYVSASGANLRISITPVVSSSINWASYMTVHETA